MYRKHTKCIPKVLYNVVQSRQTHKNLNTIRTDNDQESIPPGKADKLPMQCKTTQKNMKATLRPCYNVNNFVQIGGWLLFNMFYLNHISYACYTIMIK